mmetsp:Transcript_9523/g.16425  ORF Transcript_9523/g.16425 Transcript_9523/m.16425 type:complete len:83 (+) Transcript_9523:323-571(+)
MLIKEQPSFLRTNQKDRQHPFVNPDYIHRLRCLILAMSRWASRISPGVQKQSAEETSCSRMAGQKMLFSMVWIGLQLSVRKA